MRRNNLDIEADILDGCYQGSVKTWIVYGANLNFSIVTKYLDGLISRGLLEQDGKLFFTTEKGKEYVKTINACKGFQ